MPVRVLFPSVEVLLLSLSFFLSPSHTHTLSPSLPWTCVCIGLSVLLFVRLPVATIVPVHVCSSLRVVVKGLAGRPNPDRVHDPATWQILGHTVRQRSVVLFSLPFLELTLSAKIPLPPGRVRNPIDTPKLGRWNYLILLRYYLNLNNL